MSEADVKAAREVLRGLYAYPPHSTVQALAAALASARAEGEAAGLERIHAVLEPFRRSEYQMGWIPEVGAVVNVTFTQEQFQALYQLASLRALTPEGKR